VNNLDEILLIEKEIDLNIPKFYNDYLSTRKINKVFGLELLGIQSTYDFSSVFGATLLLRLTRPLLRGYLVIRLLDERTLCLDLLKGNQNDAPLVEINLNTSDEPRSIHPSFIQYIEESQKSETEIKVGIKKIKHIVSLNNKRHKIYSHSNITNKIPFKARDWRIHRCCVHDSVVGLTAFRYNDYFNGIEVDTFLSTEHPNYEEGHGTKALLSLILSDAYRNGTSMEVRFTKYGLDGKRIADIIPNNLLSLISTFGIKLVKQDNGIITNCESINIYSLLIGIQNEVINIINTLELKNEGTLQGICFLINNRVWTIDQVNWLVLNSESIKYTIFGKCNPENRINYSHSLCLGRSVCAFNKLKETIIHSDIETINEVEVNIKGALLFLTSLKPCSIKWVSSSNLFHIDENETIAILSRPRSKWININDQINEDIVEFKDEKLRKIILYSNDVLNYPDFIQILKSFSINSELIILVIPYSAEELDDEVINKMKIAKKYRI